MIRANSLLYAVFICLILGLMLTSIIFFASLNKQLNAYYSNYENIIICNESALNFSLNKLLNTDSTEVEFNNTKTSSKIKSHGIYDLLEVKTLNQKDTVTCIYIVNRVTQNSFGLYIPSISRSIYYFGNIKIGGTISLPNKNISPVSISGMINNLEVNEKSILESNENLPPINRKILDFLNKEVPKINSKKYETSSTLFNSFQDKCLFVKWNQGKTYNLIGNLILFSKDSICINKHDKLEDVVIISPKIRIESGFNGSVQLFADEKIFLEKNVNLKYPSALVLKNKTNEGGKLIVAENCKVFGPIVCLSKNIVNYEKTEVFINKNCFLMGNIYCEGKLNLDSNVFGSVYTNMISTNVGDNSHYNTLGNVSINFLAKPEYFSLYPVIQNEIIEYEVIKKIY